mmetsp:Transcript_46748/g.69145  ORF Transcript_46748/g.69145 Transcript_46748/m.69145 type:complete len:187 (+) Transcript_46748:139-699(+)
MSIPCPTGLQYLPVLVLIILTNAVDHRDRYQVMRLRAEGRIWRRPVQSGPLDSFNCQINANNGCNLGGHMATGRYEITKLKGDAYGDLTQDCIATGEDKTFNWVCQFTLFSAAIRSFPLSCRIMAQGYWNSDIVYPTTFPLAITGGTGSCTGITGEILFQTRYQDDGKAPDKNLFQILDLTVIYKF